MKLHFKALDISPTKTCRDARKELLGQ